MVRLIGACNHRYGLQVVQWHLDQENLEEPKPPVEAEIQQQLERIVHLAQCTLTEPSDYQAIIKMLRHFGVALDENYQDLLLNEAESILIEGPDLAISARLISYEDMLWLPYLWNLQPKQYEWVFVDEAQDLSAAQLNLILKCKRPKGRMLFIGDDNQACYGFAGADCYSFQRIRDTLRGAEFPLSVCYRCGTKILELARELVPHIEPRPDALEGKVESIFEDQLPKVVKRGDLVICRLVAPLITWCIELIKKQIPARVKGRDVGKSLTAIVRRVAEFEGFTFAQFPNFLSLYQGHRIQKLKETPYSEGQIALLNDKIDGILNCYKRFNCSNIEEFCEAIEALFSDQYQAVMLSTVHSAKGLEEERVFILYPEYLPMKWENQQPWEYQQERNLKYIAITRSKSALFFVHKSNEDRRKELDVDELSNPLKLMITHAAKSHR
jgi:superfamily I DNA/RNA helicase